MNKLSLRNAPPNPLDPLLEEFDEVGSRVAGVSLNTVSKLLVDAGNACAVFDDAIAQRGCEGGSVR
jgi:hypothetical protein